MSSRISRIGFQKRVYAVAVREHAHDLMQGNPGGRDARLSMANPRMNRDSLVHSVKMPENRPSGKRALVLTTASR